MSQASKARAEEQRTMEQARKVYEEEEEEEGEMTDTGGCHTTVVVFVMMLYRFITDTSDEEFEEPAALDVAEHSDVCSDLEEEEGGVAWEDGEGGMVGVESLDDTDEEDLSLPLVKRKRALKLLDSDDSDEEDTDGGSDGGSDLLAGRELLNESSMPPLRLESVGESNSPDPLSPDVHPIALQQEPSVGPPADSGLGQSYEQEEGGDMEGVGDGTGGMGALEEEDSNTTAGDIDSLEWSFQWGQSLPLAQLSSVGVVMPAICRGDSDSTQDMWREESQVMPTTQFPSRSVEDGETQFLDEDG